MTGKKTIIFLLMANLLLLCAGWVMAFYSYPRLPQNMPLWINFLGQPVINVKKSMLFFIYPLVQTIFYVVFWQISRIKSDQKRIQRKFPSVSEKNLIVYTRLKKEFVFLVLIFFNLIFIHLQRSIILLAHKIEEGISEYYFYSLFGIILILIPYFRLKRKLVLTRMINRSKEG